MISSHTVAAIAAISKNRVIASNGKIPWHIPEDLKLFSDLTKEQTVIMGRKTYQSLPEKFRPLPGRLNIVISKTLKNYSDNFFTYPDLDSCICDINSGKLQIPPGKIWVIGGEQIYSASQYLWDEIYLSVLPDEYQGDKFFPKIDLNSFKMLSCQEFSNFNLKYYQKFS